MAQNRKQTPVTINYSAICTQLGYYFRNFNYLEEALSHRSLGNPSNERLEFLGDAVLNLITADELFYRYPEMKEGELSRLRANLVKGEVLAELAEELQIGTHLKFGPGELGSKHQTRNILADAMEAIIGAIYLDSSFMVVQRHVLRWFSDRLYHVKDIEKDPKTRLQEFLQMKKQTLPTYTIIETTGAAHARIFKISCTLTTPTRETIGHGTTKRAAEQDAASKMLQKLSCQ